MITNTTSFVNIFPLTFDNIKDYRTAISGFGPEPSLGVLLSKQLQLQIDIGQQFEQDQEKRLQYDFT